MITAQEVKDAMTAANIERADSHDCCLCGEMVGWERHDDRLFYRSACGCGWSPLRPCDWQEAADHINRQTRNSEKFGDIAASEALKFGITLPPVEAA